MPEHDCTHVHMQATACTRKPHAYTHAHLHAHTHRHTDTHGTCHATLQAVLLDEKRGHKRSMSQSHTATPTRKAHAHTCAHACRPHARMPHACTHAARTRACSSGAAAVLSLEGFFYYYWRLVSVPARRRLARTSYVGSPYKSVSADLEYFTRDVIAITIAYL